MALILALGSNQGDKLKNLLNAKRALSEKLQLVDESQVYCTSPVYYENQPKFYNQILQFKIPNYTPHEVLSFTQQIENSLGRLRTIPNGPRTIDIDIVFFGDLQLQSDDLILPQKNWNQRSFVIVPLKEIQYWQHISQKYSIDESYLLGQATAI